MSSSDVALSIRGVGKAYTIRHSEEHITLAEQALYRARHPLHRSQRETFWALEHIDFDLAFGEVAGLIGRNGAGKSTLLKVLSRITPPTRGEVRVYGRVGSLLEVGTGFHPELTGRENVYLNGAILGMRTREIDRRFDEIVQFAGVERFLDTPVKRYSSGMFVRLAFAVAAHVDTEILLLDEVLAVGDAAFQAKCLGKVEELATAGRSVILVSHNMANVRTFATTAVLLEKGAVACSGATSEVLNRYEAQMQNDVDVADTHRRDPSLGTQLRMLRIELDDRDGTVDAEDPLRFAVSVRASEALRALGVGIIVRTRQGEPVAASFGEEVLDFAAGSTYRIHVEIPEHRLAPGRYFLTLNIGRGGLFSERENLDWLFETVQFDVLPPRDPQDHLASWHHSRWGNVRLTAPRVDATEIQNEPLDHNNRFS